MIEIGQKRFNTTGPCFPNKHYMLEALARLPDIEPLIADELYFVLHTARQAGKTTVVKALVKKLNAAGRVADERIWREDKIIDGKTSSPQLKAFRRPMRHGRSKSCNKDAVGYYFVQKGW